MYKPSTIQRRIERRQAIHQLESIEHYVEYLRRTPMEAEELFRDLLIGVTNFFRDPKIFKVLEEQVIPKLFEDKRDGATIRVWSAGCSTGEEAYSLAILVAEKQAELKQSFGVQIFATDIDKNAIASARAGLFPASIAANCSAERLARYFTSLENGNAYRIHKNIRDMLIFSEQDLIKDPPFSRLDLISCRNLLIYLNAELQKRLIPLFHYALNPGGFLLLGSSETIGEFGELFTVVDRQAKLYQRKGSGQAIMRAGAGSMLPPRSAIEVFVPLGGGKLNQNEKMSLQRMTEAGLLEHSGAAGVLVNAQGDILYLHGRMGLYLEPQPGEGGVGNILKMARDGLRPDLSTALQIAWTSKAMVIRAGLRVKTNGDYTFVNLTIRPFPVRPGETGENSLLLAIFERAASLPVTQVKLPKGSDVAGAEKGSLAKSDELELVVALEAQLRAKEEYLQASNEELETSIEELKSSNEEMQSVNEELQSTNEELETSKEELQSVNEELATVNTELQAKVADLSRLNNDMNNLLSGTGIGTVFLDHQLRILRFTPAASAFVNLIASDAGRPIQHLVPNLGGLYGAGG